MHTDVAEVDCMITHDHVCPQEDFVQGIGVLPVEIEVLLAVVDFAGLGAHLAACSKNIWVLVLSRRVRAFFAVEAVDDEDSVGEEALEFAVEALLLSLAKDLLVHHVSHPAREAKEGGISKSCVYCLAGLHDRRCNGMMWLGRVSGGGQDNWERDIGVCRRRGR